MTRLLALALLLPASHLAGLTLPAAGAAAAATAPDPAVAIDSEATLVFEALRARIRGLQTLEMTTSVTSRLGDADDPRFSQPAGPLAPVRLQLDFRNADLEFGPISRGRWDLQPPPTGDSSSPDAADRSDAAPLSRVVFDGSTCVAIRDADRSFTRTQGDMAVGSTAFLQSLRERESIIRLFWGWAHPDPNWLERMAGPVTGLRLLREESIAGEACRVLEIRRVQERPVRGGDPAAPSTRAFEVIMTVAIADRDGLPRRITVVSDSVINREEIITYQMTILCVAVTPDIAFPDAAFSTRIPDGHTERSTGTPAASRLAVQPGQAAPAFSLQDETGRNVTLESLRGSVVLLDFWATWCGPCEAIKPVIDRIARDYEGRGLTVLGVNVFEPDEAVLKEYLARKQTSFRTLLGGDQLAAACGIKAIPTLVLIHRDGTVAHIAVGMADTLRQRIDEALARE